ncbi:MAG: hypothetical protein JWP89_1125 [Schlesneria sp.]|nr:hypothetical protein [Schlesneria sp.]
MHSLIQRCGQIQSVARYPYLGKIGDDDEVGSVALDAFAIH